MRSKMIHDGGSAKKPAAKTATISPSAAALNKLQTRGASSLTDAERALLGMRPAGAPAPAPAAKAPAAKTTPAPAPTPVAASPAPAAQPAPVVVAPTPPALPPVPDPPVFRAVKSAPIDTVSFVDESFSSEFMTDILFEDVGGLELLAITRSDTVNGQQVIYQPLKNLNILQDTYNPNNLLRLQETSDRFFANFMIKLNEKIPKVGSGENGANYYLDLVSGDGVIELINLKPDEQVELQIANAGTIEDVGI